jgi:hypothetical protein
MWKACVEGTALFIPETVLLARFGNNPRSYKFLAFLDAEVTEDSQY